MMNLVIVESPAKAKTIEKFLGKDYIVKSSYGHIRDLKKKDFGIDLENNFKPNYEISADKKKIVTELKKASKSAKAIWLATDEDREGEAIAWHLAETLGFNIETTNRIVFHEITKSAIVKAIGNPRKLDLNLVNAQQSRRFLDRIVGFKLSPILWRKIRSGLSAGRVQSVAVRLIVEREKQIENFKTTQSFKLSGNLAINNRTSNEEEMLQVIRNSNFKTKEEAKEYLKHIANAKLEVASIEKNRGTKSPKPPFTTSSLQQEASIKLGFSVKQTMNLAQSLYEEGLITYMRTDSFNLSEETIKEAERYIISNFGQEYTCPTRYKTNRAEAQEAHEAIRPTSFTNKAKNVTNERQQKLYNLIYARALASQMSPAKIDRTKVSISIDNLKKEFLVAKGETINFLGYLKAYTYNKAKDKLIPQVIKGQELFINKLNIREVFSKTPARYNEASLVRELESLGIGRPSTYAPTIDTIQKRGYVLKTDLEGKQREYINLDLQTTQLKIKQSVATEIYGADKNKLVPTDIAFIVNEFLVKHFANITDYQFTAQLEDSFDKIAKGELVWKDQLRNFVTDFDPLIKKAMQASREEAGHTRFLGEDPITGDLISVKMGRYGAYVQKGMANDEVKPIFAALKNNQKFDTLTLEEALESFKLPRVVGKTKKNINLEAIDGTQYVVEAGTELIAKVGPFGPYIQFGTKKFAPIKDIDPLDITLDQAVACVIDKLTKDTEKILKIFKEDKDIQVHKGRWGPYLTNIAKNINAKLDKKIDYKDLKYKQAKTILEKFGKMPRNARWKK